MLKYDSKDQFKVERGYLNRTRIYLYPAVVLLKSYRPYMVDLREDLLCVSYYNESLILYYDRNNSISIKKLIEALKSNNEYMDDYMQSEDVYAIRIKLDLNFSAFEEGTYSQIYKPEQINRVFSADSKTKKVLLRKEEYKQEYVELLNQWFNTKHSIDSLESRVGGKSVPISEFDIPPCFNQEILDYGEEEKRIKSGRAVTGNSKFDY